MVLVCVGTVCTVQSSLAQAKIDTISLKKGEVLDILLLSQNPDTEEALKSYFQIAFPVAKSMSYQPLPGFIITDHSQGNLRSELLILGKWKNLALRETFLTQIVEEVADFHERRRNIWAYFGLRYFELKENYSFTIHRDRYQVATAYWLESEQQSSSFYDQWQKEIQASGGEILIQLKDGKSPFGYQYNPEYFVLTSWKSKAAFEAFSEKVGKLELDNIQHVNEFILQ